MWYCVNCGTFVEREIGGSDVGLPICPNCHTEELKAATECKVCGEWTSGEDLCEECSKIIDDGLIDIMDELRSMDAAPKLDKYDLACLISEKLEHDYL